MSLPPSPRTKNSSSPQQGLGIYAYGVRNNRLDQLYLQALESHYLYAKQLGEEISPTSQLLIHHGASTLYDHYLESHYAGDVKRAPYSTPALSCAFMALQLSASAQSTASAEAILPISKAFNCESAFIESPHTVAVAAHALYRGSEFILRDLMLSDVPGKAEFLGAFTTKCCRGAGIRLSVKKEVFDGTDARYGEFLNTPYYMNIGQDPAKPSGIIDAGYLLRMAAGWGALKDAQLLVTGYGADVNDRDWNGETALLKACRAGHQDVVEWLVTKGGALADIGSNKNVTPLHWLDSFPKSQARKFAKLLYAAKGDPNAVMTEEFGGSEGEFWFFKGPPLMRVVASGNLEAVEALLEIGADPRVQRMTGNGEDGEYPFLFAVRRARLDIIKAMVRHSLGTEVLWTRRSTGGRPIFHILASSPVYLAKIHRERFEEALLETFDYFWSHEEPERRLFKSMDGHGRISISVAVAHANFPLVKCIVESCPTSGHMKELVVTVGMQTAIVEGKYAIFKYLLDNGGLALHPALNADPEEDSQFETYVTCGPWTPHLAEYQLKTNSLHLCAQAGEFAQQMCDDLLRSILPASRWDYTPEHLRKQDIVNCSCNGPLKIDPLVDSRNELGETPFFLALQAEEYAMAFTLYQAGASQNVTIPHRAISMNGMRTLPRNLDGLPLAEHLLTWTSAYRALHFIIHRCWGCLRLTSSHGDELRTCVVDETAKWPVDEASELFEYVQERSYPGFTWNKTILYAIKMRNEAVVSSLLRKREELLPDHREPGGLYDEVRSFLFNFAQDKLGGDRAAAMGTLTAILLSIKKHYPEYPLGSNCSNHFVDCAIAALRPEIQTRVMRYEGRLIGLEKLEEELNRLIFPWLVCSLQEYGQLRKQIPLDFQRTLRDTLKGAATVVIDLETCQVRLVKDEQVDKAKEEQVRKTNKLAFGLPQPSRSEPARRRLFSIRTLLKPRK
ncbi:hypothetical protein B0J11DRAFT_501722 [Dendryphion nanum]|uniref:Ankyrin repeat protein n=1 Tax=Dendryphion nanum TaxID=256645 RepID=A0A9P9J2D9_9PLEO|nr:hypothetical protein B0J11DRAFT_501722 [Dendryphion nanum]